MFLAYREHRSIAPSAWEPLAGMASRLMEPRPMNAQVRPGADMTVWQEIKDWVIAQEKNEGMISRLERNFILNGFPDLWRRDNWKEALDRFRADLSLFGVNEEKPE
jgi:hypothetical protein